uniref:B30.2/SPRY domain-containing protein n=1 Tax=Esox lucius TaxID=8010 RepID=A0A6Q2WVJ9_ESOLU
MKSNRSMGRPYNFQEGDFSTEQREQQERSESEILSGQSVQSHQTDLSSRYSQESSAKDRKNMNQKELADTLEKSQTLLRLQHQMKTKLKKKYEMICEGSGQHENQTLLKDIYTELYITEGGSKGVNEEHEVRQIEMASKRQTTPATPIKCNDIFKPIKQHQNKGVRRNLTKGIAGIGKTVSVQKVILDWAEEKANQDVHLIFPLPFRDLNLKKDQYSLMQLISHYFPELQEINRIEDGLTKTYFIFDGLDECRLPLDFKNNKKCCDVTEPTSVDVLLTNLIEGNLLPSALLWITTRPAAANRIPPECVDQVTEIRGFNEPQKEEYFRKKITDQNLANEIIKHIKTCRSLHIMCHIPVFCWISATVLETMLNEAKKEEIPKTLTQMYEHFLLIQTSMKNKKYNKSTETNPKELSQSDKDMILKLSKLAFQQLQKGNLIFYEEDLRECGIVVSEASEYSALCTEIFKEEYGLYQEKVFSFVHLTIQEFLAAVHVLESCLSKEEHVFPPTQNPDWYYNEQMFTSDRVSDSHRRADRLSDSHRRAGRVSDSHRRADRLSDSHRRAGRVSDSHRRADRLSDSHRRAGRVSDSHRRAGRVSDSHRRADRLSDSHRRAGRVSDSHRRAGRVSDSHRRAGRVSDSHRRAGRVSDSHRRAGRLSDSHRRADRLSDSHRRADRLSDSHRRADRLSDSHRRADRLSDSHRRADRLSDLHRGAGMLSVLHRGAGMFSVLHRRAYRLSDPHRRADRLSDPHRRADRLSDLHRRAVDQALKSKNGHLDLFLRFLLGLSLESNQNLLQGILTQTGSTTQSNEETVKRTVEYLSDIIMIESSPERIINLFHCLNELGANSLVEDIQTSLRSGTLSETELQPHQCSALAYLLLMSEEVLEEFDMKTYKTSKEGYRRLLPVVKTCKRAILSSCGITEEDCASLVSAVKSNPSHLKELDLSYNQPEDSGVIKLSALMEDPQCRLETLKLSGCGITEKGGGSLVSALKSNPSHLKELDLSNNVLKDSGVKLLSAMLDDPQCRLETLRLSGCRFKEEGCRSLASTLKSNSSNLKKLDLSDNDLANAGVQLLFIGLVDPNCKLESLRLSFCGVTEEGCDLLASALMSNSCHLRELDLSNNDLGNSGAKCLSSGLGNPHCKLETLRLSGCLVTEEGCGSLVSGLKSNPSHMKELDLSYNHPGDLGVRLLSAGLKDPHWRLEKLNMDHGGEWRLKSRPKRYVCDLTLDPITVNRFLRLSEEDRKVTRGTVVQPYPDHPERFEYRPQVLCRESLSGRCYWEVEWSGREADIGVTYKGINRRGRGDDSCLGDNDKSWCLYCVGNSYSVRHNNMITVIPVTSLDSHRVGVYLDWSAGTLSFYRVSSDTLTHLYTFNTTFTEPLYPGFYVYNDSSVSLCHSNHGHVE